MLWPHRSAPSLGWGLQGWPQDTALKSTLASVESFELSINRLSLSWHLLARYSLAWRGAASASLWNPPCQLQAGAPGG